MKLFENNPIAVIVGYALFLAAAAFFSGRCASRANKRSIPQPRPEPRSYKGRDYEAGQWR